MTERYCSNCENRLHGEPYICPYCNAHLVKELAQSFDEIARLRALNFRRARSRFLARVRAALSSVPGAFAYLVPGTLILSTISYWLFFSGRPALILVGALPLVAASAAYRLMAHSAFTAVFSVAWAALFGLLLFWPPMSSSATGVSYFFWGAVVAVFVAWAGRATTISLQRSNEKFHRLMVATDVARSSGDYWMLRMLARGMDLEAIEKERQREEYERTFFSRLKPTYPAREYERELIRAEMRASVIEKMNHGPKQDDVDRPKMSATERDNLLKKLSKKPDVVSKEDLAQIKQSIEAARLHKIKMDQEKQGLN
ncbi:MAG: hypothetical protein HQ519_02500 [Planctomycetes bacterium]|nr:hypothetical protein [Planctomycetota bacterium]